MTRMIAVRRSMGSENPNPRLNFWRIIYGSLTDNIVLEWCKIFGSKNNSHQNLHWKNLFPNALGFQEQLLKGIGLNEATWANYWEHMKKYRDQHVAHRDPSAKEVKDYPRLDYALLSGDFYYSHLIKELEHFGIDCPTRSMITYYEKLFEHSQDISRTVHYHTRKYQDLLG